MKSMNIYVVLIMIIGLASGVLLVQESMLSPRMATGEVQFERLAGHEVIEKSSSSASSRDLKAIASDDRDDSDAMLMDEGRSVKLASTSAAAEPVERQETMFSVTGLKEKSSSVYVAVFESETGFPKSELSSSTTIVSATDDQVQFALELPLNQSVAIAVFQDIDGNGKLSKNAIGIPTEPYGFSNNARGVIGPPSFSQAVITISDASPIEIRVR
ncbi:MAG: DUF2141 domain-containing protein [Planctomyces sp.]|nr:DUF2141 domain-containing protein [Planctomyces sp.]